MKSIQYVEIKDINLTPNELEALNSAVDYCGECGLNPLFLIHKDAVLGFCDDQEDDPMNENYPSICQKIKLCVPDNSYINFNN